MDKSTILNVLTNLIESTRDEVILNRNIEYIFQKELSGGIRQRVALIHTLAVDPNVLIILSEKD